MVKNLTIDNYIQLGLLVITLISLISPVLVALINNCHNYKVRKLEINSQTKQEILKNFALSVNMEFTSKCFRAKFRQDLNLLYIYFDVNDKLVDRILNRDYRDIKEFQDDVTKLMKGLSKQV